MSRKIKVRILKEGGMDWEEREYEDEVRGELQRDRDQESPPSSSDYREPGQGDPEMDAEETAKWDRYEEENPAIDELLDIMEKDEEPAPIAEGISPEMVETIISGAFAIGVFAPVAWFFASRALGGLFNTLGKEASARQWKRRREDMAQREKELDEQREAELILLVEFLIGDPRFEAAIEEMISLIKARPRGQAEKKQLRKDMRKASIRFNKIVRQVISDNEATLTSKKKETYVNNIRDQLHSGELLDRKRNYDRAIELDRKEVERKEAEAEIDSEEYVRLAMEEPPYEEYEGEMQAVRGRAKSAGKLEESRKIHVRIGRKS